MKMIFLSEEEFRAIIREEYKNFPSVPGQKSEDEQPVTQQEICNFLNITEPTLIRWKRKGLIPFLQIGSRQLFLKSKVLNAIENKKGPKNGK